MKLTIGYTGLQIEKAQKLAARLNLPLDNQHLPRLHYSESRLELLLPGVKPLYVNFYQVSPGRQSKDQALVKACKPKPSMHILDACAGWGRDALVLCHFGAQVTLCERHPVMAALLEDALLHAPAKIQSKLCLINEDAKTVIQGLTPTSLPDLIYIDPMHPERQKSALVKKDMQALQQLIGVDEDAGELIQTACASGVKVVVKWPARQPALLKPTHSIEGKTVRFDRY